MEANSNFTSNPYAIHMGYCISWPVLRTHKQMQSWSVYMLSLGTCYAFELDMAKTVKASDIDVFLSDPAWAICSTYHTVLKASSGAAIFGQDMLFDIPFIADWQKIGEHRQQLTDLNNPCENEGRIDYDYKVGQKVLLRKEGILRNAESRWHKNPWLITSVHTNGTITVQRGKK
jgi:hypothetical protein